MNADADKILQSLEIPAKANQQLSSCSLAVQQMVVHCAILAVLLAP